MAHELVVWLYDSRIGMLSLANGKLCFQYEADWLNQPHAMALSCSLPLQTEPFNANQSRLFFAGLLPEGNPRHLISRQLHISTQNDFALLEALGGECAGAVRFLPLNQMPQGGSTHPRNRPSITSHSPTTARHRSLLRRPPFNHANHQPDRTTQHACDQ